MSARPLVSFVLVLSCLCCASVAGAQTNAVTLAGVVTDDTGGALPGAMVTATNGATGLVRTATTDTAGRYTVLGLPPGSYNVVADFGVRHGRATRAAVSSRPDGGARLQVEDRRGAAKPSKSRRRPRRPD